MDVDAILARMRADAEHRWPERLIRDIRNASRLRASERRLLEMYSHGLEYAMIADATGLSLETVKTELRHARLRLSAKNTAHACCIAIREGVIA